MLKTLRSKLIFAFSILASLVVVVILLNLWYNRRIQGIHEHRLQLNKVNINILKTLTHGRDFINYESINPEFFETGNSEFIEMHREGIKETIESMEYLIFLSNHRSDIAIKDELINLNNEIITYEDEFEGYAANLRKRGFYEYGLVGELRKSAHELEDFEGVDKSLYLALRRAEKDYLLRIDTAYFNAAFRLMDTIEAEINTANISAELKAEYLNYVVEYKKDFKEIIRFDRYIGYKKEQGLSLKLKKKIDLIESQIEGISQRSVAIEQEIIQNLRFVFLVLLVIQIIMSVILSLYLASRFSKPISKLSTAMNDVVESDFKEFKPVAVGKSNDELARLKKNFNSFLKRLEQSFEEIEKAQAETQEINEVLRTLNKEFKASKKKLEQVDAIKNKMFQIVAHDLRVPFTNLSGFLEAIRIQADSFSPEELQAFGEKMRQTVSEMRNMSTTLLQWALSQSEGINYNPRRINVENLFRHNLDIHESNAAARLIQLETVFEGSTEITSDPDILNFVLRNLITNSMRNTDVGGKISLRFYNLKSQYRFEVEDNGRGYTQEQVNNLFEINKQIDYANTDENASLGIGLALCKEFIQVAEGEILVESEVGKGTKFTIDFIKIED